MVTWPITFGSNQQSCISISEASCPPSLGEWVKLWNRGDNHIWRVPVTHCCQSGESKCWWGHGKRGHSECSSRTSKINAARIALEHCFPRREMGFPLLSRVPCIIWQRGLWDPRLSSSSTVRPALDPALRVPWAPPIRGPREAAGPRVDLSQPLCTGSPAYGKYWLHFKGEAALWEGTKDTSAPEATAS
jgi:hypothetical protein